MRNLEERLKKGERDPKTFALIGAALEVHRLTGPGHLEAVHPGSSQSDLLGMHGNRR